MSDVPSWLNEENINTAAKVASNPAVQKAAKDPTVQAAAVRAVAPPPPPPPPKTVNNPAFDPELGKPLNPPPSSSGGASSEFVIEEETLKQMQNWHLALRAAYIASTVLMCVASALSLQNQSDIGIAFFACYVFFFAVLICCFEFALNVSDFEFFSFHRTLISNLIFGCYSPFQELLPLILDLCTL